MKPSVLMLTMNDLANTGWRFKRCLEMLGYKVMFLKGQPSSFGHEEEAAIDERLTNAKVQNKDLKTFFCSDLRSLVRDHDIIHFIAGTFIDTGVDLTKKKVVVQHGGVPYLYHPDKVNQIFNRFVDATIIQYPLLLGRGAKNEHLIYYPINTEQINMKAEKLSLDDRLVVGHFPSTPLDKGTKNILPAIDLFEKELLYVGNREIKDKFKNRVPWKDNLERMKQCDVIIESVTRTTYKGQPSGEWGNTCLEAAALSKLVITNSLQNDVYEKEYGKFEPLIANDTKELIDALKRVLNMSEQQRLDKREAIRSWAVDNHSIERTAERLYKLVYSKL